MSPADYKTWVLTFGGWLLCNDGFSETPPRKNKSFPLAGTVGMQTYASVVGHCLEFFINWNERKKRSNYENPNGQCSALFLSISSSFLESVKVNLVVWMVPSETTKHFKNQTYLRRQNWNWAFPEKLDILCLQNTGRNEKGDFERAVKFNWKNHSAYQFYLVWCIEEQEEITWLSTMSS